MSSPLDFAMRDRTRWVASRRRARGPRSGRSRPQGFASAAFLLAASLLSGAVRGDNFANVYYDGGKDQLVVTIFYRGTNPDHHFSLQWGTCKVSADGATREIAAEVLDSQWQDAAVRNFRKTTRFSLADVTCRPAKLTLRTAPRFLYTLQIPARRPASHERKKNEND